MKPRSRQAEWITADPDHVPTIPGITRLSCSTPDGNNIEAVTGLVAHKPIMKSAAESQKSSGDIAQPTVLAVVQQRGNHFDAFKSVLSRHTPPTRAV